VSIARASAPSIERALRANPGVEAIAGPDPDAELWIGAPAPRADGFSLLVAPLGGSAGFETGPPAEVAGAVSGAGAFTGLEGPTRWRSVHRLVKSPQETERLLEAGGVPILVRSGRTFVLLADPDENGWSALPSFPLSIARLVEAAGAGVRKGLEVHRAGEPILVAGVPGGSSWLDPSGSKVALPTSGGSAFVIPDGVGVGRVETPSGATVARLSSAVLSSAETHVSREKAREARAPVLREAPAPPIALVPWIYAAALASVLALLGAALIGRRAAATPKTQPASAPVAAIRRTARS
jgi:hypothetical protein